MSKGGKEMRKIGQVKWQIKRDKGRKKVKITKLNSFKVKNTKMGTNFKL